MKHIVLLERCHAYFRGVQERTPDGLNSIDKDLLAKEINDYLNHVQTHAKGCWSWGPAHYMCAYNEVKRLRALLEDDGK